MNDFFIMEDFNITEEELNAIDNHFIYSISYNDWENGEILVLNKDDFEEIDGDLIYKEDKNFYKFYDDQYLELPSGRLAFFKYELLHKEDLAQIN